MSNKLTPEQERELQEVLSQPVWDGGDAGELINLRERIAQLETALEQELAEARKRINELITLWRSAAEYEAKCEQNAEYDSEKAYRQGRGEIYTLLASELKYAEAALAAVK